MDPHMRYLPLAAVFRILPSASLLTLATPIAQAADISIVPGGPGASTAIACVGGLLTPVADAVLTDTDLSACLADFGTVMLTTVDKGSITFSNSIAIDPGVASTLKLQAEGDIFLKNFVAPAKTLDIEATATGDFTVGDLQTSGGALLVEAASFSNVEGYLDLGGAGINIAVSGDVSSTGAVIRNTGAARVRSGGDIAIGTKWTASNGGIDMKTTNGSITSMSWLETNGKPVALSATGTVTLGATGLITNGGQVDIEAGETLLIQNGGVKSGGGAVSARVGGAATLSGGGLASQGGAVHLDADGDVDIRDTGLSSDGGDIYLGVGKTLSVVAGGVQSHSKGGSLGEIVIEAAGAITVSGLGIGSSGGDISLTSSVSLSLFSSTGIISEGGNILLRTHKALQINAPVSSQPGSGGGLSTIDEGGLLTISEDYPPSVGKGNITLITGYLDSDRDGIEDKDDAFPFARTRRTLGARSLDIMPASDDSRCSVAELAVTDLTDLPPPPGDVNAIGVASAFTLSECNIGETVTVSIDMGAPIELGPGGVGVFKVGEVWTAIAGATVSGSVINYALTDGGEYDADGEANGIIVDPVAIGQLSAVSVPALPLWGLLGLGLSLAGWSIRNYRRAG